MVDKTSRVGSDPFEGEEEPIKKGIFQKTTPSRKKVEPRKKKVESNKKKVEARKKKVESNKKKIEARKKKVESNKKKIEARKNKIESIFLADREKEQINMRMPIELNDWLNNVLLQGKRQHGRKIPKELWVQGALELLRVVVGDDLPEDEEALEGRLIRAAAKAKGVSIKAIIEELH